MQLDFINSNWHRQYPFRDLYGMVDLNGMVVPSDILVSCRLTVTATHEDVYVDKIYTNDGYVSISFASALGPLGYAAAWLDEDNEAVVVRDYSGAVLGSVIVGNRSSTIKRQTFRFDTSNGLLEPTCFLIVDPPWVTSFLIKGQKITGDVVISSATVNITNQNNSVVLSVKSPDAIESRKDKLAKNLTCTTPVTSGINEVQPTDAGNIDIYAIAPLSIAVVTINGVKQLQITTPNLTKEELCKIVNLPPINPDTTYPDIATVTAPEYHSWPQYN